MDDLNAYLRGLVKHTLVAPEKQEDLITELLEIYLNTTIAVLLESLDEAKRSEFESLISQPKPSIEAVRSWIGDSLNQRDDLKEKLNTELEHISRQIYSALTRDMDESQRNKISHYVGSYI